MHLVGSSHLVARQDKHLCREETANDRISSRQDIYKDVGTPQHLRVAVVIKYLEYA